MSASLGRLLIAVSTALLIVLSFTVIILSSPHMLVGFESAEPMSLTIERSTADNTAFSVINLNEATAEELMSLPDLGEVLAARIISYREQNGPFTSVDALINVKGVGEARLQQWKPYLSLG